jgi:hypothetical protein
VAIRISEQYLFSFLEKLNKDSALQKKLESALDLDIASQITKMSS